MGKKRFVVLASEGSGFSNAMQEIVDTETGAHYLTWPMMAMTSRFISCARRPIFF
jgi:hypothetical protein